MQSPQAHELDSYHVNPPTFISQQRELVITYVSDKHHTGK
jgi:hypothetical protein